MHRPIRGRGVVFKDAIQADELLHAWHIMAVESFLESQHSAHRRFHF
jgi:hypothetical protein